MIIDVDLMVENCPSMEALEEVIGEGGTFTRNMMGGYKWYPSPEISGGKKEIEIDIWRIEESIEPGDEPTPEMGVSRFDLNINALGWDIAGKRFINPLGGLESILDESKTEPMELLTEKIKPGNAARLIHQTDLARALNVIPVEPSGQATHANQPVPEAAESACGDPGILDQVGRTFISPSDHGTETADDALI